ncbi:nitroreductase family deazaflavin-dependent oxidoreductase [Mycobacterium sp. MYCO198283]|uniref:nitroreductase family deazaflavin-dependent oxidoreductase n=1 Tax=Mycobacterium sp. MYCO198283 TaxID=2883505 RepID=UPI001E58B5BE|nr:nitroreductase family deazaflavin-dependent oxidoreductase [Mycobacterium sp. MYCO198283]MCG5432335.1 nitroreductase family deazaflavin-dependent oxidoreductase [Mycobacterium sp. MYCO198283]
MQLPQWLGARRRAQFNRQVVNRLVGPLSGHVPLWSVVEHTGRRSGRVYRTPVTMFRTDDGVAILLPYGRDTDWVRNLRAAGGGRITMTGTTLGVSDPRVVPTSEAVAHLGQPWKLILGRLGVKETLLLSVDR